MAKTPRDPRGAREPSRATGFTVAAVGIVFGLYPAIKAAKQDPIVALRHD